MAERVMGGVFSRSNRQTLSSFLAVVQKVRKKNLFLHFLRKCFALLVEKFHPCFPSAHVWNYP